MFFSRRRYRKLRELWMPIIVLVLLLGPILMTVAGYMLGERVFPFAEYYWILVFLAITTFVVVRYQPLLPLKLARYLERYKGGEAGAMIEEFSAKYGTGDRSPETLFVLSTAYAYTGRGLEAEIYARELLTIVEQRGDCTKENLNIPAQRWCKYAILALSDSLVAQGRFSEAAHYLTLRVPLSPYPDILIAFVAYCFYLDRAVDSTRATIDEIMSAISGPLRYRLASAKYQFMLAYLAYKVSNTDTLSELRGLRLYLADWEDEAQRNAANPYGARLREILEEIRSLLAIEQE